MFNLVITYKSGYVQFAQVAISEYPHMLKQLTLEGRLERIQLEIV